MFERINNVEAFFRQTTINMFLEGDNFCFTEEQMTTTTTTTTVQIPLFCIACFCFDHSHRSLLFVSTYNVDDNDYNHIDDHSRTNNNYYYLDDYHNNDHSRIHNDYYYDNNA